MSLPYGLDAWFPLTIGELQDPIVLGGPGPLDEELLQTAWRSCKRGQALVVVDAIQGSLKQGLLARFGKRSLTASLERAWSKEGQAHRWLVLPSTGGSHVLLPADGKGFRAGVCLLPAGRRLWRAARRLLQVAASFGCANRFGFSGLLVAIKGEVNTGPACAWLAKRPGSRVAISLGVPGFLRKATLRICDPLGRAEGFLKVALGPGASPRVAHEASTLERFESLHWGAEHAPRLLDSGCHAAHAWMVQSPVAGSRSTDVLTPAHVCFLEALAKRTGSRVMGAELPTLMRSREHLDALAQRVDGPWIESMTRLHAALSNALGSREVPCALAHGDFTPWNLAVQGDRLAAFDWEFANWQSPILSDLIHFHLQTGILVRRVGAKELLAELEALLASEASGLLSQHGLCAADGIAFIALEVLRAATDDEALNHQEHPGFEQVDWLRDTRQELAELLLPRLTRTQTPLRKEVLAA